MYQLGIQEIVKFLPHAAPFLLVDRILEIIPTGDVTNLKASDKVGTRVVGMKNVSFNEPYFQGHFPGYPIVPGVLIVETMAQVASFALYPYVQARKKTGIEDEAKRTFECILLGVDKARFRKPVIPGDVMRVEATLQRCRGTVWGFDCVVTVEGQVVAESSVLANFTI